MLCLMLNSKTVETQTNLFAGKTPLGTRGQFRHGWRKPPICICWETATSIFIQIYPIVFNIKYQKL